MLTLRIISPEKVVFDGEVIQVIVPGTMGEFEILVNHAPIISSLEIGTITYKDKMGKEQSLQIQGGFVEVQKNIVSACVEL